MILQCSVNREQRVTNATSPNTRIVNRVATTHTNRDTTGIVVRVLGMLAAIHRVVRSVGEPMHRVRVRVRWDW